MIKKHIWIGAATAAALCTAIPAAAAIGHAGPPQTRADVSKMVADHFAKADANKDGFITEAEAQAAGEKRMERMKERGDKRAEKAGHRDPAKMFARLDTNKDGKLTKAEVDAAEAQFAAKHADRLKQRADKAAAKGGQGAERRGDRLFANADTNKDGVITLAELTAAPKPEHPGKDMHRAMMGKGGPMGRMFQTADSNKDGRISLAEAQAEALAHFDKVDTNHDGKISPEEHKAARASFQGKGKPAS